MVQETEVKIKSPDDMHDQMTMLAESVSDIPIKSINLSNFSKASVGNLRFSCEFLLESKIVLKGNFSLSCYSLQQPLLKPPELVKLIKKFGEDTKVAVRNIRRDANDHLKKEEKEKKLSEDQLKDAEDEVQKLTDEHTKLIDDILKHKETEIIEV